MQYALILLLYIFRFSCWSNWCCQTPR